MKRHYVAEVDIRDSHVILRLTDAYGEREYELTMESAATLSAVLESAVATLCQEHFTTLPQRVLDVKSGVH